MADEPAQKRARTAEGSLSSDLLEQAKAFAKDGLVSYPEAVQLWQQASDGQGVSDTKKLTLAYTMTTLKYTDKAKKFMIEQLDSGQNESLRALAGDKKRAFFKVIDGVKYDRALLEMAEQFQKDGVISHAEAKKLWEDAMDGRGVTPTEKRTLEYTMTRFKYTDEASDFMKKALGD